MPDTYALETGVPYALEDGTAMILEGDPYSPADDFDRPDGRLGPNWITAPTNGVEFGIVSNQVTGGTNNAAGRWVIPQLTNFVYAETTYVSGAFHGPCVAMPGFVTGTLFPGAGMTWYSFRATSTGTSISQKDAGLSSSTSLASTTYQSVAGDVLRLEYDGVDLVGKVNGVEIARHTPVAPLSLAAQPYVGMILSSNAQNGLPLMDNFRAGSR